MHLQPHHLAEVCALRVLLVHSVYGFALSLPISERVCSMVLVLNITIFFCFITSLSHPLHFPYLTSCSPLVYLIEFTWSLYLSLNKYIKWYKKYQQTHAWDVWALKNILVQTCRGLPQLGALGSRYPHFPPLCRPSVVLICVFGKCVLLLASHPNEGLLPLWEQLVQHRGMIMNGHLDTRTWATHGNTAGAQQ